MLKKIISGSIAMSMIMGGVCTQLAYASEGTNGQYSIVENNSHSAKDNNGKTWLYYNLKNGTILIDGTEDVASSLEVPQTLDGKTVSVINHVVKEAVNPKNNGKNEAVVKIIKLPKTVEMLQEGAFSGCKNLTNIEMSETVKMPSNIFASCPNVRINGHTNMAVPPANVPNLNKGWNQRGNDRYYVNSNGEIQTGWIDLDGKRFYFYGNGQMAVAFINLGEDSIYYLDSTPGKNMGNLITGWKYVDGDWYYFNSAAKDGRDKGYMQTGWLDYNGNRYYFYGNGQMATGFINLGDDYYYYLDESDTSSMGTMKTGWQKIQGKWFYFNTTPGSGFLGMMKKGWQKIDGNWYYFYYDEGSMAHDTWIDGYYVNSNGVRC